MTTVFRVFALLMSLMVLGSGASRAQAPAAPPAGMTQEQFDSLVEAISKSVADRLKAEGRPPAAAKPAPAPTPAATPPAGKKNGELALFVERAGKVLRSYPALGDRIVDIVGGAGQDADTRWSIAGLLLFLAGIAVAAVLAEAAVRRLLGSARRHLAARAGPETGLRSLANLGGLLLLDAAGLLVVWLICNGAAAWLGDTTNQDKFAESALGAIFNWRLTMLLIRFVLQPDAPAARLCAVKDDLVPATFLWLSVVLFVVIIGRVLGRAVVDTGTPPEVTAAFQIVGALVSVGAFLWLVFRIRDAARQWLEGLSVLAPAAGVVGRHWVGVAGTFFVALGLAQIYSTISGRVQVGGAMMLTLGLVAGLLLFETLMQAAVKRLDSQLAGRTPASNVPKLPDVVARCVRVAVLIGLTVTIAQSWVVDVLGLASPDRWDEITRSSRTAAITLFLAFVLWELFKYVTEPYMARAPQNPAEAVPDDAAATPASRIGTMMPLLRTAAAILIIFLAIMIALEDFGINVMPLLAGASIFGIAISFGSQTLVRDIVSGIFYLTDDAFRVGEYIDCGRAKGTVEGFTLRSIKLRHQNGQVHTIPFGQLGQITNFSRDWITVKFNLRFARDTDIEKLRKTAKKIGQEMLEVPEIKAEILAPFKMQGVADIVDNALLVRFKFTARPGNPAMIQREAVKRMFKTLPGLGIEFAKEGAAVIVHTTPTTPAAATA